MNNHYISVFMKFQLTLKLDLHRILKTDQRRKSKTHLYYANVTAGKSISVLKQYTIKSNRILLILLMKVSSSQSRQTVSQKKSVVDNILGLKAGKIDIRS